MLHTSVLPFHMPALWPHLQNSEPGLVSTHHTQSGRKVCSVPLCCTEHSDLPSMRVSQFQWAPIIDSQAEKCVQCQGVALSSVTSLPRQRASFSGHTPHTVRQKSVFCTSVLHLALWPHFQDSEPVSVGSHHRQSGRKVCSVPLYCT